MVEIRHLRMIAAVQDTGSLTAAARHLHLTQSALSRQLAELEETIGTAAFLVALLLASTVGAQTKTKKAKPFKAYGQTWYPTLDEAVQRAGSKKKGVFWVRVLGDLTGGL